MKAATIMKTQGAAPKIRDNRFAWWMLIIREGVAAGTLGGAIVALWYLLCDSVGGRPFHTPALLGAIFFNGLRGHDVAAATLAPVLSFTVLHFAAFIAFGLATAAVIAAAEREPLLALGALMVYACFEICFIAFVAAIDASALGALGLWKIAASNAITLVTVFGYFQYQHPQILRSVKERWIGFEAERSVMPPVLAARVIQLPEVQASSIAAGIK